MHRAHGWMTGLAIAFGGALGCELVSGLTGDASLGNPKGTGGADSSTASSSGSTSTGSSASSSGTGGAPTCHANDCGGPGCPLCGDGKPCTTGTDCQSGVCQTTCQSNYVWAKSFGNGMTQRTDAVAVNGLGDTVVTGAVLGTLDFGSGAQPTAAEPSPFLVALDTTGKARGWSAVFPDMGLGGEGMAVTSDAMGSGAVISGGFNGSLTFQNGKMLNAPTMGSPFLVSASSLSSTAFGTVFTSTGGVYGQAATGVLVDAAGNVIMTGYLNGMDFGCGALGYSKATSIFLVKLDPTSKCLWSTTFGGQALASGVIALDPSGDVVVAGRFTNFPTMPVPATLDFGNSHSVTTAAQGLTAIFVAKLDAMTGHGTWAKSFGDAAGEGVASGVAVDSSGNVVITGAFHGTIDFGDGPISAVGSNSMFVAKRDGSGNHLWSKAFGDANVTAETGPAGIAIDAAGKIAIGGQFDSSIDFGGGALKSAGDTDIFAVRFDPMGNHLWSRRFGDAQKQTSAGIAVAPGGNLVLAGNSVSPIDFGGGPLPNSGGTDIFVARLRAP